MKKSKFWSASGGIDITNFNIDRYHLYLNDIDSLSTL